MRVTAGLDGWKEGWVAVELAKSRFSRAFTTSTLSQALTRLGSARVIGVDMPIGFPPRGVRRADLAARDAVGPRRNSVFLVPPRSVIEANTYAAARTVATSAWDRGLSAQTYALRNKILEIADLSRSDDRLIEVHPEVSYCVLAGEPLPYSKKTWNGQRFRLKLLESAGIGLPDLIEDVGRVPTDDLLDATVAAWSADRHARGKSAHLPPDADPTHEPVIWY